MQDHIKIILIHFACETESYWQVKQIPGFSRVQKSSHAVLVGMSLCPCHGIHEAHVPSTWQIKNEEFQRHSWPWSGSSLAAEVSMSSHFVNRQRHQTRTPGVCDEDCGFSSFPFSVPLPLFNFAFEFDFIWWHWKQQVLKGRGWKMNQRRAKNLYQITQMTFFRTICGTPWNMVDPSSAPQ